MVDQARQALQEFMGLTGKTQRQLSKETGLSTAVISQFLNGVYTGDNEEVSRTINRYLTVGKQRLNNVQACNFYEGLYNTQETLFAASYAHRKGDIVLVCGDSGAGKSTALAFYRDNNVNVIFVTANSCTKSAGAVLNLISKAMGGRELTGKRDDMIRRLIQALEGSNRLIIIDEADHLTLDALQAVRAINDEAHVGIVLAGNERIYLQMKYGSKSPKYKQLDQRILVRKRVYNDFTAEEIAAIFPKLDDKCSAFLLKLANSESLRIARKLFDIALENAGSRNEQLGVKHLKATHAELLGGEL
jgi:DNA transposition AAA+ family ATPase